MTHFTVAIIIPPEVNDILPYVERQMRPYDENIEVEPYVCYSPEQAATDIAETIHRLELIATRQEKLYDIEKCRQSISALRSTTPEEYYRAKLRLYDTFNDQGEPLSTRNPESKWDWYVIGGRWDGWLNDCEASTQCVDDNIATTRNAIAREKWPHAIVTPDGCWHERGRMGWWAILITEAEDWDEQARALYAAHHDCRVVIIDAHI